MLIFFSQFQVKLKEQEIHNLKDEVKSVKKVSDGLR